MKRIFAIILMALLLPVSAMGVTFQINVPDYNAGIGTDLQAYDADLTTIAGLTVAEGKILRVSSSPEWAVSTFTIADTFAKGTIPYASTANTITALAHPGAANYALTTNGTDTLAWSSTHQHSDSAAQFYSNTASKGTMKILLSGSTDGKLMTLTSTHTDNRTVTMPDVTGTLSTDMSPPTTTVGTSRSVAKAAEYVFCSNTCSVTPPTPVAGYQLCVMNAPGSATVITMANITDVYYGKTDNSGWQANANYKLVSGGAATDKICIVGYDTTHYIIMSSTGTWTHTAP